MFWKCVKWSTGLWWSYMPLVLILCIAALVWSFSWLFSMNFVNESVYSPGRDKVSYVLERWISRFCINHNSKHFLLHGEYLLLLGELHPRFITRFIIEWKQVKKCCESAMLLCRTSTNCISCWAYLGNRLINRQLLDFWRCRCHGPVTRWCSVMCQNVPKCRTTCL